MTFRQWAERYCFERAMFPDDAIAVVDSIVAEQPDPMQGRWHHDIEGYPGQIKAILAMTIDRAALRWIDANCPAAWFRPMFAPQQEESC